MKKKTSLLKDLQDRTSLSENGQSNSTIKWRTIIALILMYIIIFTEIEWAWGILFLIWVIPDVWRGSTYFIEPIHKNENKILYWIIVISWILMALYSLSTLLIDYEQFYY